MIWLWFSDYNQFYFKNIGSDRSPSFSSQRLSNAVRTVRTIFTINILARIRGCPKEKKCGELIAAESEVGTASEVCKNHTLANALWYAVGAKLYAGGVHNNILGDQLLKKIRHTVGHFKHSGKKTQELNKLQFERMNNANFDRFPYDRKAGSLQPKRRRANSV